MMAQSSLAVSGGLQLHLVDGRSVYPIEASALQFRNTGTDDDGFVRHVAKHKIDWEAEEDRPAVATNIEVTVLQRGTGEFAGVMSACSGWFRKNEGEFVLDANVISDGLAISQAPTEGELA